MPTIHPRNWFEWWARSAQPTLRNDRGLRTNRLDIVAVGIDQERRVIGRAVIGARSGAAIVAAAGFEAFGMKLLDRRMIPGAERDMRCGPADPLCRCSQSAGAPLGPKPAPESSREHSTKPSGASAAV